MKHIFYSLFVLTLAVLTGCNSTPAPVELQGIRLNKQSAELENGSIMQLYVIYEPEEAGETAGTVSWESSRKNVASVSPTGRVEALNLGTTTITAVCGRFYADCKVTVVKEEEKPQDPEEPENPNTPDPTYELTVTPASIDAPAEGGTYQLTIKSNAEWTVAADADWIMLDTDKGGNDGEVEVTVAATTEKQPGKANITFKYGTKGETVVNVTREAYVSPEISVNTGELPETIALKGGTYTVKVSSELPWNATCSDKSVEIGSKTDGSVTITFPDLADNNIATEEKNTKKAYSILFSNGKNTATWKVSQWLPYLYFTPGWTNPVSADGGKFTVSVYSNIEWTNTSDAATWIVYETAKGSKNGSFTVTVNKNTTGKAREWSLYARHNDWYKKYYLQQNAK